MKFTILCLLFSISAFAQEIKSVNYFQEGEVSKLVIELDKETIAERFHVTDDKQIILDVKNAKGNSKVLRGIDTSEFNGSTVYVSGYQKPGSPNDIRFAIQLRDNVRSMLEVNKNKVILNIENRFGVFSKNKIKKSETLESIKASSLRSDEDSLSVNIPKSSSVEDILENLTMSGPKKYIGKKISLNVKDISVEDLLKMIADTSGFNIIIDQAIKASPPLTLTLTNIPWDQALDTIMSLSKLVASKNANILSIKTLAQATTERESELKANQLKQGLEPLVTKIFPISYSDLASLRTIVQDYVTPERGRLQQDDRTNSLIVRDTVETIERIKKIIETLDMQTPQVLIEAKIVEITDSHQKDIGLRQGLTFGYDPIKDTSLNIPRGPGFSFSTAPTTGTALGMTVGVYKRLVDLNFNLQMMEVESKARIISSPKVITQNKKSATLTSSEQQSFPVQSITGTTVQTTFQNVAATLNLTVLPQVTNEGAISMQITINKGSFGAAPPIGPPNISTRSINTNVLVDNGSTVVLGGLYSTSFSENHTGIPVLKDLPLIGWLFRSSYNPKNQKSELIVFITPRIINQEEAGLIDRTDTAEAGQAPAQNPI
jgi:type IV pilus assembly protein PilQ